MKGYYDPLKLAELLGIERETVHKYKVRGDLPEPDEHVGRTPLWREETINKWLASRRGHGWRAGQRASTPEAPPSV
ncbi:helix-turn-helix transcriptional regulator [Nonomuraea sp. NPDC050536]|uniref:helix-turn-helix transcriptional regulator n=1 Tax=Nonomuraea sp. NPDC050536 TaxID=3364366 RepID=UPI0037C59B3D